MPKVYVPIVDEVIYFRTQYKNLLRAKVMHSYREKSGVYVVVRLLVFDSQTSSHSLGKEYTIMAEKVITEVEGLHEVMEKRAIQCVESGQYSIGIAIHPINVDNVFAYAITNHTPQGDYDGIYTVYELDPGELACTCLQYTRMPTCCKHTKMTPILLKLKMEAARLSGKMAVGDLWHHHLRNLTDPRVLAKRRREFMDSLHQQPDTAHRVYMDENIREDF